MKENTSKTEAAIDLTQIHVPADMIKSLKDKSRLHGKRVATLQEGMFELGELLAIIKDKYCGGDTKVFGAWLLANCPEITQNYIAFYIEMYRSKTEIKEMLKDPKHKGKTSPQTIARAYRESKEPAKNGKKGKTDKKDKSPKGKGITLDGLNLDGIQDLLDACISRVINYKAAQEFSKDQKARVDSQMSKLAKVLA